jgi:predicted ATPase/DNA-binding CsgD family transcriptional regulator
LLIPDTAFSTGNLPAEQNSFVGRERDLAELAAILRDTRALTLCGPGGIGKTRLALRLAGQELPGFPDGAWMADLSDVIEPRLVAQRAARTLGIVQEPDRPLGETLAAALRPRELLLILDTCEHVVDACADLVQLLLASCPRLQVIATSREPLRVRGETVWRVPPLELPAGPGRQASEQEADLARHEAVRLFAERAASVRPDFTLTPRNAPAVAALCRTLDGMPLAIELAAARMRALSVEQVAARINDRFQLLASGDRTAPARQQTLRAAVDWSYELLTGQEQLLLRRLSVFSGWNLDMAEQVCADEAIPAEQVLDLLAGLIDKSLVTLDGEVAGDARYRLLDTVREYAGARLTGSGEHAELRLRHRDYMLAAGEADAAAGFASGGLSWPERVQMFRRSRANLANYQSALEMCLERADLSEGLRIAAALRSPWLAYGDATEGLDWYQRLLSADGPLDPRVHATALAYRAELAFEQQDYQSAGLWARGSLDICESLGSQATAGPLRVLALVALRENRYPEALSLADAAAAAAETAGDNWEHGLALSARAAVLARQGRLNEAQRGFERALDVLRDNNGWGVAQVLYGFGGLARARRDYDSALRHYRQALDLYREIDVRPEIARCQAGIGWVGIARHDPDLAASSLTESLRLSLATGQRLAMARGLEALALLAVVTEGSSSGGQQDRAGQVSRALRLLGAALALREAVGHLASSEARARLDRLIETGRRELGAATAEGLLSAGAAMSADAAVAYATAELGSRAPAPGTAPGTAPEDGRPAGDQASAWPGPAVPRQAVPASVGAAALTAREREIAVLISRGLSNRAIADELVISPATAARHVANIFTKLGFTSRAQLAAWVAGHRAD